MKINLTIIISILLTAGLVALGFTSWQVYQERQRLHIDLERRAVLLGESISDGLVAQLEKGRIKPVQRIIDRVNQSSSRLSGLAVYDLRDSIVALTEGFIPHKSAVVEFRNRQFGSDSLAASFQRSGGRQVYLFIRALSGDSLKAGMLVAVYDASYIDRQIAGIWKGSFIRWFVQALVIAFVTLLVIRWSILRPLDTLVDWMRDIRTSGKSRGRPPPAFFEPLKKEVDQMADTIAEARAMATEEAKLRATAEAIWTPERLKEEVRQLLDGRVLVAVSNREPYMHVHRGKAVDCIVPASGLVTAMEPVLKACGGIWVAAGMGDADRETVDDKNVIRVPPDDPRYTLRRVWMSKEEEEGFYYGFSNEGLWPLCHVAHARPTFRIEDWRYYQEINIRFADVVIEEVHGLEKPLILVQDYHFALLPRLIKKRRPDAQVAIFWHIPWPNPESFGICPWQKDLLYGMLGADMIGFHTQYHCNNFMETVDRALESQITWEHFSVKIAGHTTLVKPFPISIAFTPRDFEATGTPSTVGELLKEYGIKAEIIGVGVDRIDYTKGIVERFLAIERFLERYPAYQGKFTFVELGAPSRTHIKRYADMVSEVEAEAERINWRFKTKEWRPILFLKKHHSHQDIQPWYRAAQVCLVTSLHDGMNLVAKEFIASRGTNDGTLILSRFAGAARELRDALIVNPYDVEQTAEALRFALEMPVAEQQERMQRMRQQLVSHNIYLWAADLIRELTAIRLPVNTAGGPKTEETGAT
ncbi:trehalose-6-phosphate synthase [candidate division TA06 bacterium]|uniref:Trehalose-6-phosphate synthase n=1 Tax=candidate division TA06 bacterium TaxID=2250710 RepID=A0A933MKM4_UNCT6|nr:trehalose-6-phosphate synthase [candidate division TA06 bacterium]